MNWARDQEKCPGCGLRLSGHDLDAQTRHMQEKHPEIIERRLTDAGFVRGEDGRWVDTMAGGS